MVVGGKEMGNEGWRVVTFEHWLVDLILSLNLSITCTVIAPVSIFIS